MMDSAIRRFIVPGVVPIDGDLTPPAVTVHTVDTSGTGRPYWPAAHAARAVALAGSPFSLQATALQTWAQIAGGVAR
jgi:TRAP-type mannitol/chloroaromatic compound transport system substrate-binding protein